MLNCDGAFGQPERILYLAGRVDEILDRVGDKWSIFIVLSLNAGPKRFNEIRRTIGIISQRMLTLTLRGLERDGLVTRTVTPIIPPRVDYELTNLGRKLVAAIKPPVKWADDTRAQVESARMRFDQKAGPVAERRAPLSP
ncbi:helix-turn-helix transcriptional regulator [Acidobacteria bacterium AB60]|nr:helix-turn-helix transcriptional regulator [Acidobacteria bacterium AB60]